VRWWPYQKKKKTIKLDAKMGHKNVSTVGRGYEDRMGSSGGMSLKGNRYLELTSHEYFEMCVRRKNLGWVHRGRRIENYEWMSGTCWNLPNRPPLGGFPKSPGWHHGRHPGPRNCTYVPLGHTSGGTHGKLKSSLPNISKHTQFVSLYRRHIRH
jgi:hypothetical protein